MGLLHKLLKLSHHSHTNKRLPNHASSHGVLLLMVLLLGVFMSLSVQSFASADITEQDQIGLSGVIPALEPTEKAVILMPKDGSQTSTQNITVSGSCQQGTFIQIFRNDVFAGSTVCLGGEFSLIISLVTGNNTLIAKTIDNLKQYGPDSDPVTVTFTPDTSPGAGSGSGAGPQLSIRGEDLYLRSVSQGVSFKLDLAVQNGSQPYAVHVDWGDGSYDTFPVASAGDFTARHVYNQAGLQVIHVTVTDEKGNKAHLQYVVIINGPAPAAAATSQGGNTQPPYVPPTLPIVWPMYLLLLVIVLAFWLGERYELRRLKRTGQLIDRPVF